MSNAVAERRLARFSLLRTTFQDSPQAALDAIFAGAVVVHTESHWMSDAILYTVAHPRFDPVLIGTIVPEFTATVDVDENGTVAKIEWKRVE